MLVAAGADENVINTALQGMGVETPATNTSTGADAGDGRVEPTMDNPASTPAQDTQQGQDMAEPTLDNAPASDAQQGASADAQQGAEQGAEQGAGNQQQGNVDVAGLAKLLPSVGKNPTPFKAACAAIKTNKPLTPVMKAAMGNAFMDLVYADKSDIGKISNLLKKVSMQ